VVLRSVESVGSLASFLYAESLSKDVIFCL
jgi:hypothetical protein